ncbi:MAG: dephospho-CoA kinase [Kiritimatiellia bacterium]
MCARIALTGGIACGKSLFAKFLSELGIRLLDADDVVHELEAPGGAAVAPIRAAFGDGVLDAAGGIDRRKLAEVVFADGDARRRLEDILFPLVRRRLNDFSGQGGGLRIAVIPLLFESHWESDYDIILCISSSRAEQVRRMMATRSYTRRQAEARLAAQMPVEEKVKRAHLAIRNDTTPDNLRSEARRVYAWLNERLDNEQRRSHD